MTTSRSGVEGGLSPFCDATAGAPSTSDAMQQAGASTVDVVANDAQDEDALIYACSD